MTNNVKNKEIKFKTKLEIKCMKLEGKLKKKKKRQSEKTLYKNIIKCWRI